jgi:hypothetical protein
MHRQIETSDGGHAVKTSVGKYRKCVCFPNIFVRVSWRMLEIPAHNIPQLLFEDRFGVLMNHSSVHQKL